MARIHKTISIILLLCAILGTVFWLWGSRDKPTNAVNGAPASQSLLNNGSKSDSITPEQIVDSGVPQDGIPSIDKPAFVSTTQALEELGATGMGLAVVKGSVARFYPYQILTWHEVVNDVVAGMPMAVTYCALCNVGVVYESTVQSKALSFGVSGKLHELDSLLYDRATNSLWSQVTGEAISGTLSGQKLTQVPALAITLKEFSAQYPGGQVLSKFTGFIRNYDDLSYGDYAASKNGDVLIAQKNLWHPKTRVVGIEISGKFKAYPQDLVEQKTITDTFAGARLRIGIGDGKVVVTNSTDPQHKTYLPSVSMYWFMWQLWHADTQMYK